MHLSTFVTPVYRIPSGYSETYREHLEQTDPRPMRKVLLDPAFADLTTDGAKPLPPVSRPPLESPDPSSNAKPTRRELDRMPFDPEPPPKSGRTAFGR